MALFDAGFRSSIAPRPTRLAAGVRLSSEQDLLRLCDIAPTSFTPHYTQKFEDQAKFTSGISRFLTAFLAASRSRTPDGHVGQKGACSQEKEECGGFKSTTELQKDLWETIASGVQNHELARRLRPLWSSMTGHPSGRLTKPPDHTDHGAPLQDENPFCEISNLSLHQHSSYPSTDEEDLFDCTAKFDRQANRFPGCMPIATYQDNDGRHNAVAMDICDAEMGDPRSNRYCEADSLVDSHDRNRGRTGSMSQTSDVSTFMTLEQPIEEAPIIGQPGVIGGPRWLAQHIIRTHPLRQHESEVSLAEQCDLNGKGHSLCERAGWRWSEESLSSEGLLESQVLGPQYTTPQGTGICSSLVDLHKQQLTPELRDAAYGSIEHSKCDSTPILMSAQQGASSSNAPLADVLGDDHLLWYMWKRRASVALRGEEEVHEMRNMYEMDPDMKVFGAGWGIDLSDIGPESNEDPMLQDNMENPSPMGDDTQPPTPTSERRSFFSPIRSASSSSAVGSRNSSSKLHSRGNILKRFSWGVRRHAVEVTEFDAANPGGRTIEVKRRKTLDDYEMMDMEASNDDSNEMLF
ncbi:hypothetical protein A1O3_07205 [Capronia epimyces CBS 606.96]|uniref:Uncharacterized protein n=1 Tax=Capronia epimyces CBS 606.96 TaxID=1182542 RepID=W9XK92_9EURO|nr:uncharacterized protein A1O3_07205 [Capronia epimyces CBS 606.96]EXJ80917.1 hypothetical protein A1O3_07205 [Capronia epimyces CBS 606.96]